MHSPATRSHGDRFLPAAITGRMSDAHAGFSLVEVLVAMGILLVVMGAIFVVWLGMDRTYAFTQDDVIAQQQARQALGEMIEYIRTARMPSAPPSEELEKPIVEADSNSITIWTDTDRDPSHDLELVRFRVDQATGVLYRDQSDEMDITFSTGTSVRLVTSDVANDDELPLFDYYDFNGNLIATPVADPWAIREVHINLRVDLDSDRSPVPHLLRSIVQPRNLRQY